MVERAGDVCPSKRDRQPLSVSLSSAVAREAAASRHVTGNKKAHSPPPTVPGVMADCAFSRDPSYWIPSLSVCASSAVYCVLSRT